MPTHPWNDDPDSLENFEEFEDDPEGPQECDLSDDEREADRYDDEPCPHCGEEVSELAERCPHCGHWIARGAVGVPRAPVVIVIAILLVLLLLFLILR